MLDLEEGIQGGLEALGRATFENEFFVEEGLEPSEEGRRMCINALA